MKLHQTFNWVLCSRLLFLALLALAEPLQQKTAPVSSIPVANAKVADLKGKVRVQLPGQAPSAPSRGQVLPPETTITTEGGRILLQLEDGSQILVNEHSRLLLKQPSQGNWQRLQMLLGRIKAEIQKRMGGTPNFKMSTPSAVISVRGTRFSVEVDKHKATKVSVEEGEVQLESAKGIGKPVLIQAGHKSRVKENSAPEAPQEAPEIQRQPGNSGNGNNGRDNSPPGLGSHGNSNPGSRGGGRKP